jgi:hypothetical protein
MLIDKCLQYDYRKETWIPNKRLSEGLDKMLDNVLQDLEQRVCVESEGAKNSYLSNDGKPVDGEEFRERGYWHSVFFQSGTRSVLELYVIKLQVDGPRASYIDGMRLVG